MNDGIGGWAVWIEGSHVEFVKSGGTKGTVVGDAYYEDIRAYLHDTCCRVRKCIEVYGSRDSRGGSWDQMKGIGVHRCNENRIVIADSEIFDERIGS